MARTRLLRQRERSGTRGCDSAVDWRRGELPRALANHSPLQLPKQVSRWRRFCQSRNAARVRWKTNCRFRCRNKYLLENELPAQLPGFASSHCRHLRGSRQVCSACKRGQFRPVKTAQPTFWLRKGGCQFTHVPRPAKTPSNSADPSGLFPVLQRG